MLPDGLDVTGGLAAQTAADPRVLELYKLAVDMADRVSARRGAANTFFVGVQTAVVAAIGFLSAQAQAPATLLHVALCLVGVLSTLVWYLLLRSYRDLNTAKFNVILEIEKSLPVKVFTDEWSTLKRDPISHWRRRYSELGSIERLAPVLFAGLDVTIAIYLISS